MGRQSIAVTFVAHVLRILSSVLTWFIANLIALATATYIHQNGRLGESPLATELYGIGSNLLLGGLVSFLFYYLVVAIPASRKKAVIKRNLERLYIDLKISILWEIVFASRKGGRTDLETSPDFVEALVDVGLFRKTFENGREANEGFYAFENQMSHDTPEFQEILLNLAQLQKQIDFLLNNYEIEKQDVFDFFKRLDIHLQRLKLSKPGYDESKPLCRFLWSICSGWDMIEGYKGADKIQKYIGEL